MAGGVASPREAQKTKGEDTIKYYHMIIARPAAERMGDKSTRKEYINRRQGSAPEGWVCVGVCGYHEVPHNGRSARDDNDSI